MTTEAVIGPESAFDIRWLGVASQGRPAAWYPTTSIFGKFLISMYVWGKAKSLENTPKNGVTYLNHASSWFCWAFVGDHWWWGILTERFVFPKMIAPAFTSYGMLVFTNKWGELGSSWFQTHAFNSGSARSNTRADKSKATTCCRCHTKVWVSINVVLKKKGVSMETPKARASERITLNKTGIPCNGPLVPDVLRSSSRLWASSSNWVFGASGMIAWRY
jgi:cytochrome c553